MKLFSHLEFRTVLFNHQYSEMFLNMPLMDWMWCRFSFENNGVNYLNPDERGRPNEGAQIYEDIVCMEAARVKASFCNGVSTLQ